jgi:hypothetical protein
LVFENGNFDNWEFAVGTIDTLGTITTNPTIAVPGKFELLKNDNSGQIDLIGGFSVYSPNGSKYCMKLGNIDEGNGVQQASYTYNVPPDGASSIILNYAVVLVNPGHPPNQQPRFTVKIYNVTDGKYLACPAFDFISSSDLPGFKYNSDGVFYKDWATTSINLTGLNGKQVRMEFTVNHCPFKEHYGYAYLDINEDIGSPIKGNIYCADQKSVTLTAPPGFKTYTWYTADFSKELGTGQVINLSPAPVDLTSVAVTITPYNGLGCTDTLYSTVKKIAEPFNFVVQKDINVCPGSPLDLTRPEYKAGSSSGLTFRYFTDQAGLIPLPSPSHITVAGTYYISAVNAGGCSSILPVNVTFNPPELTITNPAAVTFPAQVSLANSYTEQPGINYSYWKDASATIALDDADAITQSGTYYVKAELSGCTAIKPVKVTILPPPPLIIDAPTALRLITMALTTALGFMLKI